MHTELQMKYLQGDYNLISVYAQGEEELSKPEAITLAWDATKDVKDYDVYLSEDVYWVFFNSIQSALQVAFQEREEETDK